MLKVVSNSKADFYHLFYRVEGIKLEKLDTGGYKSISYVGVDHGFYDSVIVLDEQDRCVVVPRPGYTRRKVK